MSAQHGAQQLAVDEGGAGTRPVAGRLGMRHRVAVALVVATCLSAAAVLLASRLVVSQAFVYLIWITLAAALTAMVAVLGLWALRPLSTVTEVARRAARGESPAAFDLVDDADLASLVQAIEDLISEVNQARRAIAEQERAIEEKESARGQLLEKLIDAQEEERKRIARELHDGVGQTLLSLGVGLKLLQDADDVEAAQTRADELRRTVAETLEQVRMISRELRPSVLDDLGLAVALDRYADEFASRHPEIVVDVHSDTVGRLPSVVETTLYRIVQEAMTNAARHSGGGTLSVLLSRRDADVQAIIEDDGNGFDVDAVMGARSSVGLHGMAERAELIGGRLDVESSPDGTAVFVEVPL